MSNPIILIGCLLLIGYGLMVIEIAIIPGFGVVGVLGLACIIAGCVLLGMKTHPLWGVGVFVLSLVFDFAFIYYLAKTPFGRRLVLEDTQKPGVGLPEEKSLVYQQLLGKIGTTRSPLRPAGVAIFNGNQFDVVTDGDYVEAGASVRVVSVEGTKVVVQKMD